MERMMKVQDVLLKAIAKKVTWWAAAEILGVSDRTMRRWGERMEEGGYGIELPDRPLGAISPSLQRLRQKPRSPPRQCRAGLEVRV
jgi:transposase